MCMYKKKQCRVHWLFLWFQTFPGLGDGQTAVLGQKPQGLQTTLQN